MNNIIEDLRKKQNELVMMVNNVFDDIIKRVSELNSNQLSHVESVYETVYPITNIGGFKGKKVIAVIIHNERMITPTWKKAVSIILTDVIKDKKYKEKMYNLCDKMLGRVRNRLAHTSESMRSAIKLDDNLYIETHYDTETLMRFLLEILNELNYNYDDIKIVIKS